MTRTGYIRVVMEAQTIKNKLEGHRQYDIEGSMDWQLLSLNSTIHCFPLSASSSSSAGVFFCRKTPPSGCILVLFQCLCWHSSHGGDASVYGGRRGEIGSSSGLRLNMFSNQMDQLRAPGLPSFLPTQTECPCQVMKSTYKADSVRVGKLCKM